MVQKSLVTSTILSFLLRAGIAILIIVIGLFPPMQVYNFINHDLGFVRSGGFFGFDLSDWEVTWVMVWVFWSGLIYGTLSKKMDYLFVLFFILFALYDYSTPVPVHANLYLALGITIILSNSFGFALKLLRQRFLPKLKV